MAAVSLRNADHVELERIASNSQLSEAEKLVVATRHFEAILARQFLNNAYKPLFKSDIMGDDASSQIYRDMVVKQAGDAIGKTGAFGIASSLQGHLMNQSSGASDSLEQSPAVHE